MERRIEELRNDFFFRLIVGSIIKDGKLHQLYKDKATYFYNNVYIHLTVYCSIVKFVAKIKTENIKYMYKCYICLH